MAYQRLDAVIETVVAAEQQGSVSAGFNKIALDALEIRQRSFSFREFARNQMISEAGNKFGDQFLKAERDERVFVAKKEPDVCVQLFIDMLSNVKKDGTVQFVLTLLSDLTESSMAAAALAETTEGEQLNRQLLNILFRNDDYCKFQASLILARLTVCQREPLSWEDLQQYLGWTISQLGSRMEFLECTSLALMTLLKKDHYRMPYYNANGVKPILDVLDRRITFQLQYQLIFCVWMLSYNADIVEQMKSLPVAVVLCDILKATNREKVQRVILATFRNLIEKSSSATAEFYATAMIHFKAVPVLNVLVKQTRDDSDMLEDIEFLHQKLNSSLQDLSSFDEYTSELKSGRLEWSPVHKSEKFWRENVMSFHENNYEILRLLVSVLEESQSPQAIAVAAHDLGEYVRYYPRGKRVIDQLGAKTMVMNLVKHGNPDVRMQALLAIQKMMVQNWEYLGKQLEEETS